MSRLILMRHGQSDWNKLNLFTGWVDISLSQEGVDEAISGGKQIQDIPIDIIFTSALMRAQMTAMLAMMHHHSNKSLVVKHDKGKLAKWGNIYSEKALKECIPIIMAWQLNERMYGELQGLNKQETMDKYGEEQVRLWRRSYDVKPPKGESLKLTAKRTIPYFQKEILPLLKKDKNILISAHGNSLRAITMYIENMSKEEILKLEIPTGKPICYEYKEDQFTKSE